MIKIGVLTSSRADYGIYLPLLKKLKKDKQIELTIIAFGTHLSKIHGHTISEIIAAEFEKIDTIESLLISDSANGIASSYALTATKFAEYWKYNKDYDLVFALGDRYEMAAAVTASIPYKIKFAHIHGGETTLGAIDNIYRHSISLTSYYHFVSTAQFGQRLERLLDIPENIHHIGSLSLENIVDLNLLTIDEFNEKWNIDLSIEAILVTVHPETVNYKLNEGYCKELINSLKVLSNKYQLIITMPNADTSGLIYRNSLEKLAKENRAIKLIENFGTQSYFTCMKYSKLVLGNSSSGILEAASFNKYVINIGDRQKGRLTNLNVIHVPFITEQILEQAINYVGKIYNGVNIYYKAKPSEQIINIIKQEYATIL